MHKYFLFTFICCFTFFYAEASIPLKSPWLEIERQTWKAQDKDIECDIAIVGGGISGVSTLYFLITQTDKNVVLVEKNQIASGATGNNAGIAVAAIERPISELINEYGSEMTDNTLNEINKGWDGLLGILEKTNTRDYFFPFERYAMGYSSLETLFHALGNEAASRNTSGKTYQYLISESLQSNISEDLHKYIQFTSTQLVLETLTCADERYIAAKVPEKLSLAGRINSSKICYGILSYLEKQYPNRFAIYEGTEITRIDLNDNKSILQSKQGKIQTKDIILCTNAYTNFVISDNKQGMIVDKLQKSMSSIEGYLTGYFVDSSEIYSLGYLDEVEFTDVPYFYLSQAPVSPNTKPLRIIGGPEIEVNGNTVADPQVQFNILQKFIRNIYGVTKNDFDYFWGGVMGYTDTGLRWVGQDPEHSHLWYNLGCNGIGIIPAIAGAEKIAQQFNGTTFAPSLFDPK